MPTSRSPKKPVVREIVDDTITIYAYSIHEKELIIFNQVDDDLTLLINASIRRNCKKHVGKGNKNIQSMGEILSYPERAIKIASPSPYQTTESG